MTEKKEQVANSYARIMATPEGQVVMADLEATFKERMICGTNLGVETVAMRAAQHDVVMYIKRMTELGNE